MNKVAFLAFVLVLQGCLCVSDIELSNKLRAAAPPAISSLESFVSGPVTGGWKESVAILDSAIDKYENLVRRNQVNGKEFDFRPFMDARSVRFGARYYNIREEESIHLPGLTFLKVTAIIAVKSSNAYFYTSAFGAVVGNGIQQYNIEKVEKCHKKFFKKVCSWEDSKVPRGVFPNELNTLRQGLQNILYNKLSRTVLGQSRRLQMTEKLLRPSQRRADSYQSIEGVDLSQLFDAINSLVGQELPLERSELLRGDEVAVITSDGRKHTVQVVPESDSSVEVKVWTTNA